jgi:hypothetical protein
MRREKCVNDIRSIQARTGFVTPAAATLSTWPGMAVILDQIDLDSTSVLGNYTTTK